MDELEFRKRVYANPRDLDEEVLEAARANPDYQKILDETLALEDSLAPLLGGADAPESLMAQLLSIPEKDELEETPVTNSNVSPISARKQNAFQAYAVAASLVLAAGIVFSISFNSGPSPADIIFGDDLLYHLHHDIEEIDNITNGETYAV